MPSTASAWRNHTSPRCKSCNVRKPDICYRRIRTGVCAGVRQRHAINAALAVKLRYTLAGHQAARDVRSTSESGHVRCNRGCPLSANSGQAKNWRSPKEKPSMHWKLGKRPLCQGQHLKNGFPKPRRFVSSREPGKPIRVDKLSGPCALLIGRTRSMRADDNMSRKKRSPPAMV